MGYIGNQTSNSYTSLDKQTITGNGGASYTLDHAVANVNEIEVFVNNVRQEPTVAYTVSGTALTMTGNVASTDDFYVVFQGKAIQTTVPPDGSVTSAKMDTNIDIAGTLDATGIITADAGIKLGGTASANLLNDYEEGTWTPTDASGANQTFTLTGITTYTKVGNIVTVQAFINVPTNSSGNAVQIGSLPFNIASNYYGSGTCFNNANTGHHLCYVDSSTNTFYVRDDSNSSMSMTQASGKFLCITVTYRTS